MGRTLTHKPSMVLSERVCGLCALKGLIDTKALLWVCNLVQVIEQNNPN